MTIGLNYGPRSGIVHAQCPCKRTNTVYILMLHGDALPSSNAFKKFKRGLVIINCWDFHSGVLLLIQQGRTLLDISTCCKQACYTSKHLIVVLIHAFVLTNISPLLPYWQWDFEFELISFIVNEFMLLIMNVFIVHSLHGSVQRPCRMLLRNIHKLCILTISLMNVSHDVARMQI